MGLTQQEQQEVESANGSGRQPVMFVHGLWLLAGSWDAWRGLFEERGYATLAPGWPDDPDSVAEGRANPNAFAGKGVAEITDHFGEAARQLTRPPVIIGHSFGGLITQKLAGEGLAAAAVAIDPAPMRGVLALPVSTLKASFPVLRNPANKSKAVMLTYEQWRYAFANGVDEAEAKALYEQYPVPGAGRPLFQAAFANFNPKAETAVDTSNATRGPLLIISGEVDHIVPKAVAHGAYKRYSKSAATTEFVEMAGRGHSLALDSGWREVADTALAFLEKSGVGPS